MSGFKNFLISELEFNRRGTRIAGRYKIADLGAAMQLGRTKVGGYQNFGDMGKWLTDQAKYNVRYPIELHKSVKFKIDFSYQQMYAAFTDLAERLESIASVLASSITHPEDPRMSARVKDAHFENQPKDYKHDDVFSDPTIDPYIIRTVDVRAMTGEVSGRGGTQAFVVGEALGILEKAKEIPPPKKPLKPGEKTGTDSLFDIYMRRLEHHSQLALGIFTQFERTLAAWDTIAGWGDHIVNQMGQANIQQSATSNPMAVRSI